MPELEEGAVVAVREVEVFAVGVLGGGGELDGVSHFKGEGAISPILLLATDLEIQAELIALIYRYRWQIELFFKWLKSILGCRHLMAESPEGVAIQIYSALIAALMLQLLTGKRPGKRAMELILFYLMGCAELEEVMALLGLEKSAR